MSSRGDELVSARASVSKRSLVFLVPTSGQSDHAPEVFFHAPFIPQLRDRLTSPRRIEGWPGQGHELVWVLFVAEDKCDEELVHDVLAMHETTLRA